MFKSYEVKGDKFTVTLEHAADGRRCGNRHRTARPDSPSRPWFPNGEDQVKLFYLAGEDRVWHPAKIVKIDGNK